MKYFLSIELPYEIKESLSTFQEAVMCDAQTGFRPTPLNKMHLTVMFLNSVLEQDLPYLNEEIIKHIQKIHPFQLSIQGFGMFLYRTLPTVFFADVQGELPKLHELHRVIKRSMKKVGLECNERPYVPHITLSKDHDKVKVRKFVREQFDLKKEQHFGKFLVSSIHCLKTKKVSGHTNYQKLWSIEL